MVRRTMRVVGALAAVLVAASPGLGQGSASVFVEPERVSFTFAGGSAVAYAKAVREASGEKRIVVMPGCEEYVMPPVELSGVTVEGALGPLKYAWSANPLNWMPLRVSSENDVFVVAPAWDKEPEVAIETAVFTVAAMLESGEVAAEDLLTAVETALEMADEGQAMIKYHPETRLMLVRGSEEVRDTVARVLDGVQHSSHAMRKTVQEIEEVKRRIEETQVSLAATTKELEEVARFAAEVDKLAKVGEASAMDVLEAREALIRREEGRAELEARLHRLIRQLDQLKLIRQLDQLKREESERRGAR